MLRPYRFFSEPTLLPKKFYTSLFPQVYFFLMIHTIQIFNYHWQFDIVSLVRCCWWGLCKDWHYHWPFVHWEERLSSAQAIEGTTRTIQRQQDTLHTYRWVSQIKAKAVSKLAVATAAAALPCQNALKAWMFLAMPLATVVAVADAVISDMA